MTGMSFSEAEQAGKRKQTRREIEDGGDGTGGVAGGAAGTDNSPSLRCRIF